MTTKETLSQGSTDIFTKDSMIYLCIALLAIIIVMSVFFTCLWIRSKRKKTSTEKFEENEFYGKTDPEDYFSGNVNTYVKDSNDYYDQQPSGHGDTEQSDRNIEQAPEREASV